MFLLSSLMKSMTGIGLSFGRRALIAARKNSAFVTPGTSAGYCIAKKSPFLARSSTVISRTFSPFKRISPSITRYFGLPMIVSDKVDLPVPFGPIMA